VVQYYRKYKSQEAVICDFTIRTQATKVSNNQNLILLFLKEFFQIWFNITTHAYWFAKSRTDAKTALSIHLEKNPKKEICNFWCWYDTVSFLLDMVLFQRLEQCSTTCLAKVATKPIKKQFKTNFFIPITPYLGFP
jgi:hypothetical protein